MPRKKPIEPQATPTTPSTGAPADPTGAPTPPNNQDNTTPPPEVKGDDKSKDTGKGKGKGGKSAKKKNKKTSSAEDVDAEKRSMYRSSINTVEEWQEIALTQYGISYTFAAALDRMLDPTEFKKELEIIDLFRKGKIQVPPEDAPPAEPAADAKVVEKKEPAPSSEDEGSK